MIKSFLLFILILFAYIGIVSNYGILYWGTFVALFIITICLYVAINEMKESLDKFCDSLTKIIQEMNSAIEELEKTDEDNIDNTD